MWSRAKVMHANISPGDRCCVIEGASGMSQDVVELSVKAAAV